MMDKAPLHMLSMSSDGTLGFRLDDRPPNPRTNPGDSVLLDYAIQGNAMLFGRLCVSRQVGISTAGEAIMGMVDSWRVDDVTLDGARVALTDGSVDPPRCASRVSMRATNIGETPAYFYGAWELHEAFVDK
jgi:hypothetical protein